jgi:putative transposase
MAAARFDEFAAKWGGQYPAIISLWRSAWQEFIPFLDYDIEIRKIICSTNAIESLNARYRRAVRARGHFRPSRPPSNASTWSPAPWTHRPGQGTMGHAVEARAQRLRHHLRRPDRPQHHQLEPVPVTPLIGHSLNWANWPGCLS